MTLATVIPSEQLALRVERAALGRAFERVEAEGRAAFVVLRARPGSAATALLDDGRMEERLDTVLRATARPSRTFRPGALLAELVGREPAGDGADELTDLLERDSSGSVGLVLRALDDADAPSLAALARALPRVEALPVLLVAHVTDRPPTRPSVAAFLAALQERAAVELAPAPATGEHRALVAASVDALPTATRDALQWIALLGSPFAVDDLTLVSGLGLGAAMRALEPALERGILVEIGDELAVADPELAATLHASLAPAHRRARHRTIAQQLTSAGRPDFETARHWAAGAERGDPNVVAVLRGVATATAQRSLPAAVEVLERARELADPATVPVLIADLLDPLAARGEIAEAEARARAALSLGPESGTRARLRSGLAALLRITGRLPAARRELTSALGDAGVGGAIRAELLADLAQTTLWTGDLASVRRTAELAIAQGDACGSAYASTTARLALAHVDDAEGQSIRAVARAADAVEVGDHAYGVRAGALSPRLVHGIVLLHADRLVDAHATLLDGARRAEATGNVAWIASYHATLASLHLQRGSLDDAAVAADAARAMVADGDSRASAVPALAIRARVALHRGVLEEAETLGRAAYDVIRATRRAFGIDLLLSTHARYLVARGDAAGARRVLRTAWELNPPLRFAFASTREIAVDLVRLARHDDPSLAEAVTDAVESQARRSDAPELAVLAQWCAGLLASDATALAAVADALRAGPRPLRAAAALEDSGRAGEAVAIYRAAGAHGDVRRLGGRPAPGGPAGGWAALTAKEHRVVELVAGGLTNREIGERLFVSRRTVDTHLSNVFAKLGLRSRTQLAAAVAARGGRVTGRGSA